MFHNNGIEINLYDLIVIDSQDTHRKKFSKLFAERLAPVTEYHHPDKVIFNFSICTRSDVENNLSCKGLNFALSTDKIDYADFMMAFELL